MSFIDHINGYTSNFKLGNVYGKFSDFFEGTIEKDGEVVSNFKGSYLEYIDFDGQRFWDIRRNIDIEAFPIKDQIKSSSIYRPDSLCLYERKLEQAQEKKDKLENLQRKDRALRKKYEEVESK